LLRESVTRLSNVVLQVMVLDRWIWKLHSSQRYTVKNAYKNLTVVDVDFNVDDNQVNIFIWHFLLNWIATKDNLVRRNIIAVFYYYCSTNYGYMEDRYHLFFICVFYGRSLELYCRIVRVRNGFSWKVIRPSSLI
jgi:hypothetical protein